MNRFMETFKGNSVLVFSIIRYQSVLVFVLLNIKFRFAYLAHYCFCVMLFSVSHSSIVNIFCCLCYMPGVYLKYPMLCLRCVLYLLSFILQNLLAFLQNSLSNLYEEILLTKTTIYIYIYI